jgi:integrase-like protein
LFHNKRHPKDMGAKEVGQFLSDLAVTHHVAASTQNQALSVILFLYQVVLRREIGWLNEVVRAKKPRKLPVVLTQEEVKAVLNSLSDIPWLMASLLCGSGLRLMECIRETKTMLDLEEESREVLQVHLSGRQTSTCVMLVEPHRMNARLAVRQGCFVAPGDLSKSFMENLAYCLELDVAMLNVPEVDLKIPIPKFMQGFAKKKGMACLYRDIARHLADIPRLGRARDLLGKKVRLYRDGEAAYSPRAEFPEYRYAHSQWKSPM